MGFPVFPTAEFVRRLTALKTAEFPAAPNGAKCHLYMNDVFPDENMTLDTFVEATIDGAGFVPVVMGEPSMNDQGLITIRSNAINFEVPAGTDPQTVYGIYVTDKDIDHVIMAQRFDTPQALGGIYATAVSGVLRMSEPLSSYGWIDVEA